MAGLPISVEIDIKKGLNGECKGCHGKRPSGLFSCQPAAQKGALPVSL